MPGFHSWSISQRSMDSGTPCRAVGTPAVGRIRAGTVLNDTPGSGKAMRR